VFVGMVAESLVGMICRGASALLHTRHHDVDHQSHRILRPGAE
jgi:hypothetical protein